ncbi:MAG: preprotein translocase subunit SecG [Rhodovibrionaceae bacterium]
MTTVLLVIHLLIALTMIGVVLLQRSEGGALGIGGGGGGAGGGMGGLMTGRGTANLLSRTTAILAVCFMSTSLILTILAKQDMAPGASFIDQGVPQTQQQPLGDLPASEAPTGGESSSPEQPAVPVE